MHADIARQLTTMFERAGQHYPNLLGRATIRMGYTKNGRRYSHEAVVHEPAEAAEILLLYSSGQGAFRQDTLYKGPINFSMNQAIQRPSPYGSLVPVREEMKALEMVFHDRAKTDSALCMAISGGGWKGPTLAHMAEALETAGSDWRKVNLIRRQNGSHLQAV